MYLLVSVSEQASDYFPLPVAAPLKPDFWIILKPPPALVIPRRPCRSALFNCGKWINLLA